MLNLPTNVTCDPETHRYFVDGVEYESVTALINRFNPAFAAEECAARLAKTEAGKEALLQQWEAQGKHTRAVGTAVHEGLQHYVWHGKRREVDLTGPTEILQTIQGGIAFLTDHPYLKPVATEQRIAHPKYRVAGTFDYLGINEDVYYLIDWKTSGHINYLGYERMYPPLDRLMSDTFTTYSLQLGVYEKLLKDGHDIVVSKKWIVQVFPNGAYDIHEATELPIFVDALLANARSRPEGETDRGPS